MEERAGRHKSALAGQLKKRCFEKTERPFFLRDCSKKGPMPRNRHMLALAILCSVPEGVSTFLGEQANKLTFRHGNWDIHNTEG